MQTFAPKLELSGDVNASVWPSDSARPSMPGVKRAHVHMTGQMQTPGLLLSAKRARFEQTHAGGIGDLNNAMYTMPDSSTVHSFGLTVSPNSEPPSASATSRSTLTIMSSSSVPLTLPPSTSAIQARPLAPTPLETFSALARHNHDSGLQASLDALDRETHEMAKRTVEKLQEGKQTGESYARHVRSYERFIDDLNRQKAEASAKLGEMFTEIPCYPILPNKVAAFIQYEKARPKRRQGSLEFIEGSTLGKSHIQQAINALESVRRLQQHLYPTIPEARLKLRDDNRITVLEHSAKEDEPKRAQSAQSLKAAGTSSDTFTKDDLLRASRSCMRNVKATKQKIFCSMRDRAMLLLSSNIAFRGENTRNVLWSDLFAAEVPFPQISNDHTVTALVILADNAKTNKVGRVDEHGVLRHRLPDLCSVSAVAFLLFTYFHVLESRVPSFAPELADVSFGKFGRRDWYTYYLFVASEKHLSKPLSYDSQILYFYIFYLFMLTFPPSPLSLSLSLLPLPLPSPAPSPAHYERLAKIFRENDISITKVTHSGREFAAKTAREYGASVAGVKALGGWQESGSYRSCYDRALPVDAMLGAATFDASDPKSYFLSRTLLVPPTSLLEKIFPFVEQEQAALRARCVADVNAKDIALQQFLKVLVWFQLVIMQDAAVLYTQDPGCPLWAYAPFNSHEFHQFSENSAESMRLAEEQARLSFESLPQHLANSFQGALHQTTMDNQRLHNQNSQHISKLTEQVAAMHGLLEKLVGSKSNSQKRFSAPAPAPSCQVMPPESISRTACMLPSPMPTASFPPPLQITITSTASGQTISTSASPASATNHPPPCPPFSAPASTSTTPTTPMPLPLTPATLQQVEYWTGLVARFGEQRLLHHSWEWTMHPKVEYLPYYQYQTVSTVLDVWAEWADGLNGYLSVRELTEKWDARWHRNIAGQKTEGGRRMKIVKLIGELRGQDNWNLTLALRFLADTYSRTHSPRAFVGLITSNKAQILAAASNYP